jgi:hypothetical protein
MTLSSCEPTLNFKYVWLILVLNQALSTCIKRNSAACFDSIMLRKSKIRWKQSPLFAT